MCQCFEIMNNGVSFFVNKKKGGSYPTRWASSSFLTFLYSGLLVGVNVKDFLALTEEVGTAFLVTPRTGVAIGPSTGPCTGAPRR